MSLLGRLVCHSCVTGNRSPHEQAGGLDEFEMFEALYPVLRRFAAVVADLDMDPDDLIQEALVATLQRHRLSELDQPAAYLKRAIMSSASNYRRQRSMFRRFLPRLATGSITTDSYPSDLSMLDSLAPTDRIVVFLADVEGLPHALIADQLGLTPGAVRKRVSRGRRRLRQSLNPPITPIAEGRP